MRKYFMASEVDEPVLSWELSEISWPGEVENRTVLDFADNIIVNYVTNATHAIVQFVDCMRCIVNYVTNDIVCEI